MTTRKGLGAGKGSGYRNIIPPDPRVHQQSARGMKQPQYIYVTSGSYQNAHITKLLPSGKMVRAKNISEGFKDEIIKNAPQWVTKKGVVAYDGAVKSYGGLQFRFFSSGTERENLFAPHFFERFEKAPVNKEFVKIMKDYPDIIFMRSEDGDSSTFALVMGNDKAKSRSITATIDLTDGRVWVTEKGQKERQLGDSA